MSGYQEYECEKEHRWERIKGGLRPTCFPAKQLPEPRMNEFHERWDGMSLRDWYAEQVIAALISNSTGSPVVFSFAVTAYQIADEMLVERNKR